MPDETIEVATEHDFLSLLQHETEEWQKKLRLQDWNVQVEVCRANDMPREALASIEHFEERKDAKLYLLAPCDVPLVENHFLRGEAANYDISIVHELLHLHLIPLSEYDNPVKRVAEEQVVNALSRALVAAYASTVKPIIPPVTATQPAGHYM